MSLSTSAKKELLAEISRLEKDIKSKHDMIKALRSVIELSGSGGELPFPKTKKSRKTTRGRGPGVLRTKVLAILKETGKATPAEVKQKLEESGFSKGGQTSLAITVRNLLAYMSRNGELERDKDSRYFLPGKTGANVPVK